jgi:hypothetical protein
MGDFLSSPLKADWIARTRNDCRLPAVSMVFANLDIQLSDAYRSDDHLGKLFSSPAFLGHGRLSLVDLAFGHREKQHDGKQRGGAEDERREVSNHVSLSGQFICTDIARKF